MAHKVNPIIFRLNVNKRNNSEWFSKHNYPIKLHTDFLINNFFNNISGQYRFMFEKCKIKEYMGMVEFRVFVHPYAYRKRGQTKAFQKFIITANRILPIIKNQFHNFPILKIINLPKTVPKKHLKTLKYHLRTFKWKLLRVKKLFTRHLFVINTAIYRSSSVLVAGMIAKGIGSRNRDQKSYFKFVKSLIGLLFKRRKYRIKGIRVVVRGKIHGRRKSRRSRKMKFAFGTIPYSTLTADVNYNLRHIKTKYGVFSVRVWIYNKYPKYPRKKIKLKIYTNFIKFIYQKEIKNKIKKIYSNSKKRTRNSNKKKKKRIFNYNNKLLYFNTRRKLLNNFSEIKKKRKKLAKLATLASLRYCSKRVVHLLLLFNLFKWYLKWCYRISIIKRKRRRRRLVKRHLFNYINQILTYNLNVFKFELSKKLDDLTDNKIFLATCFQTFYKIKYKKIRKKISKLNKIKKFYKIKKLKKKIVKLSKIQGFVPKPKYISKKKRLLLNSIQKNDK